MPAPRPGSPAAAPPAPATPKGNGRGKKQPAPEPPRPERPVVHPDVKVKLKIGPDALTHAQAGELLGWVEDPEGKTLTADQVHPEVSELYGVRVALHNDALNRPFRPGHCKELVQELLNRRWAGPNGTGKSVNGDTMKIGQTGLTLDMQHRGVSVKLAYKEWSTGPAKDHWREVWPPEQYPHGPVMDTIIVYGVDESDVTFKTLNTGLAASLVDVLYRHEVLAAYKPADRRTMAKLLDWGVRVLWDRTGADDNPYAPRRTHAEALEFIKAHPKVVKCAEHVMVEDRAGAVRAWVPPGTMTGLLYLFGCCDSDPDAYGDGLAAPRTEEWLKWTHWKKALEYLVALAKPDGRLQKVRDAIRKTTVPDPATGKVEGAGGKREERVAILVRGWHQFKEGEELTDASTALDPDEHYRADDESGLLVGLKKGFYPTVGGIDVEPKAPPEPVDEGEGGDGAAAPTPPPAKGKGKRVKDSPAAPTPKKVIPPAAAQLKKTEAELLADLREKHPGRLLIFRPVSEAGPYICFDGDAEEAAKACSDKAKKMGDRRPFFQVRREAIGQVLAAIVAAGHTPALCTKEGEGVKVEDWVPPPPAEEPPAPAPAGNGKAKPDPKRKAKK